MSMISKKGQGWKFWIASFLLAIAFLALAILLVRYLGEGFKEGAGRLLQSLFGF